MPTPQGRSYRTDIHTIWVLYDLRDLEGWQRAHEDLEAWGREYAVVFVMGLHHILMVFRPGGARRFAR